MEIKELDYCGRGVFEDLGRLMAELTDRVGLTERALMGVLRDGNSHLYVIQEDGHIIGCATLCVYHAPSGTKASVEDVVVSSAYRGRHLGRQLMEFVLEQAKAFAPIEIYLTSKPNRVAANSLYQSLGFKRKETNCYKMSIAH